MSEPEGAVQRELIEALTRFSDKADKISSRGNNSTSTVSINAGGVGIWIAVTCCVVSFVINLALGVAFLNHDRKIDRMQDFLAAIYAQAPHLKPKE